MPVRSLLVKHIVVALAVVAALAGCSASGVGSSAASAPQPTGQASSASSAPAAHSPATAPVAPGASISSPRCPSLADVKAATGFTDLTQAGVATDKKTATIICSYAPATDANPLRQVETAVTLTPVSAAKARQDDVQQGLTVTDAPQFGPGAFIATGTSTLYGTICALQEKAGNGGAIGIRASATDMTAQDLCTVAERVAPLFQG
jgi:hypothetical protein